MNHRCVRSLLVACAVLICAQVSNAQEYQWPMLLGPPDPTAAPVATPKHKVLVYTQGYDQPHRKWVEKKSPNKLANHYNVPQPIIEYEKQYARSLSGDDGGPITLLTDIDDAIDKLGECPGGYGAYARSFNWSSVSVHIQPTTWHHPNYAAVWVNGLTTDKHNTSFVAASFNLIFSDPEHAQLVGVFNLAPWELGNVLYWNWHGSSKDVGNICQ